ncbi:MAG: hypothetical protein ACI87E_004998 [Mariniblastus sp.]|jgi:hypothetical protein
MQRLERRCTVRCHMLERYIRVSIDQSKQSVSSQNVPLLGTEMAKTAESAIECPRNLFQTFNDHGLGVPKYGRFLLAAENG